MKDNIKQRVRDEHGEDQRHVPPGAAAGDLVVEAEGQREQRDEERGMRVGHVKIERSYGDKALEAVHATLWVHAIQPLAVLFPVFDKLGGGGERLVQEGRLQRPVLPANEQEDRGERVRHHRVPAE
jgi:hypothetical protein